MIEAAEQILLDLGFAEMRVRCHGKLARIEVAESVIEKNCAAAAAPEDRGSFKEGGVPVCKFRSGRVSQRQYE